MTGRVVGMTARDLWLKRIKDPSAYAAAQGLPVRSHNKAVFCTVEPEGGARHKFRHLFEQVIDCDVIGQRDVRSLAGYDVAIVFGDKRKDYKRALDAGIPYILIENDVHTLRSSRESEQEREMVENAAALIVTSEGYLPHLSDRYTLPPIVATVHLRPLLRDICFRSLPKLPRTVVYEGTLLPREYENTHWGYRVIHHHFAACIRAGWSVHIYPTASTHKVVRDEYEELGCYVHDPVNARTMYQVLSQYAVGFHGWGETGGQEFVHSCRPNKAWDYLGAGIPTIGFNAGPIGDIYAEGGWGVRVEDYDSVAEALEAAVRLDITDELRLSQVIENDMIRVARIVWHVLAGERRDEAVR